MPDPDCDNETRDEWMERCMADEESRRDFPDEDQRAAFCSSRWDERCGANMMTDNLDTPECRANHAGPWLIEPKWFGRMVNLYRAGDLPRIQVDEASGRPLFSATEDGIAIITLSGALMKGQSKFGGTSTIQTRRAIRAAVREPDIRGIMLSIDSPGGTVAGQDALAEDIRSASQRKPVHAFGADTVASAALWTAVQADKITAERMTEVGSIGVVAVVEDTSEATEAMGVKVHVVSTGDAKADFVDGAPVTEEALARLQSRVDEINSFFLRAVKRGRGFDSIDEVKALATGETWMAGEAQKKGLIDAVGSFDDALRALRRTLRDMEKAANSRRRGQSQRLAMLDMD